ncbi:MAG TPA: BadF/BadG/BcrA/BcrD ATPase family protein, partial [Thermoanaerobaculia bacterium]|nr:BadF/BadG/BcrA/BcrD ATPase family protein [Thermoanaerobaculia bacterium]
MVGIDIGSETIKVVELVAAGDEFKCTRRAVHEHAKQPAAAVTEILRTWEWDGVSLAAVTGRFGRVTTLAQIPTREALACGFRHFGREPEATVVSIGSRGFSVLEIRGASSAFRENSRCSQGTGNFLRQLVERFNLSIEEAAELAAGVSDPAPLSGRCPVILKTDMTHLANKGEDRARILAGLFDAVAENVQALIRPRTSPRRVFLVGGVMRAGRVRESFRRFTERAGMELASVDGDALFLEALGSAIFAAKQRSAKPSLDNLLATFDRTNFERLPPLAQSLPRVRRLVAEPPLRSADEPSSYVMLGFDIGSTGSKLVALDTTTRAPLWEG